MVPVDIALVGMSQIHFVRRIRTARGGGGSEGDRLGGNGARYFFGVGLVFFLGVCVWGVVWGGPNSKSNRC